MRRMSYIVICGGVAACGAVDDAPGAALPDPLSNSSFASVYDAVRMAVPTSDMPTAGQVTYAGGVRLDLVDASALPLGAVTGQLAFTVDFDRSVAGSATVANAPVSGTLTDVTGETADGTALFWDGALSTGAALQPSVAAVASFTVSDGTGAEITTRTGVLSANLAGDVAVTAGTESYQATALVTLSGSFAGPAGDGVWGWATATLVPQGQGAAAPALATGTGNFVAER